MIETKEIYCCSCNKKVNAILINGQQAYPHRPDLKKLPFWQCPTCKNFVGCHHKTKNRIQPLGVIANKEIKDARKYIHALLDPIWEPDKKKRRQIYQLISNEIGFKYHTANIRTIEEARDIYRILLKIKKEEINA